MLTNMISVSCVVDFIRPVRYTNYLVCYTCSVYSQHNTQIPYSGDFRPYLTLQSDFFTNVDEGVSAQLPLEQIVSDRRSSLPGTTI